MAISLLLNGPPLAWIDFSGSLNAFGNGAAVDGTNGSIIAYAKYQQIGKTVFFVVDFTLRNNSGTGTVTFNLPIGPAGSVTGCGQEQDLTGKGCNFISTTGVTNTTIRDPTGSVNWAQSSHFYIAGTYEVP